MFTTGPSTNSDNTGTELVPRIISLAIDTVILLTMLAFVMVLDAYIISSVLDPANNTGTVPMGLIIKSVLDPALQLALLILYLWPVKLAQYCLKHWC